jgi:hypothetical protein
VDLLEVWNRQFVTGTSSGLKTVALLVGHGWEVDDAGGAVSMVCYDTGCHATGRGLIC